MRKTTLVPLVVLILDVVCSARIGPPQEEKTHEAMIQAFGMQKSSSDLMPFGDNPAIERLGIRNVKTNRRRFTTAQNFGREPSIQAYGLPKRTIESNGEIERVSVDRVSGLDGKVDSVNFRGGSAGIQAFGLSSRNQESNGVIERVDSTPDKQGTDSTSGKGDGSFIRRVRSLYGAAENDLMDLETQEAKVFRPLFVYRRQVADRYRSKPRKDSIYGALQYRANRQINSIHQSRKY